LPLAGRLEKNKALGDFIQEALYQGEERRSRQKRTDSETDRGASLGTKTDTAKE
jgi:hypothetical protein